MYRFSDLLCIGLDLWAPLAPVIGFMWEMKDSFLAYHPCSQLHQIPCYFFTLFPWKYNLECIINNQGHMSSITF